MVESRMWHRPTKATRSSAPATDQTNEANRVPSTEVLDPTLDQVKNHGWYQENDASGDDDADFLHSHGLWQHLSAALPNFLHWDVLWQHPQMIQRNMLGPTVFSAIFLLVSYLFESALLQQQRPIWPRQQLHRHDLQNHLSKANTPSCRGWCHMDVPMTLWGCTRGTVLLEDRFHPHTISRLQEIGHHMQFG